MVSQVLVKWVDGGTGTPRRCFKVQNVSWPWDGEVWRKGQIGVWLPLSEHIYGSKCVFKCGLTQFWRQVSGPPYQTLVYRTSKSINDERPFWMIRIYGSAKQARRRAWWVLRIIYSNSEYENQTAVGSFCNIPIFGVGWYEKKES